MTSLTLHLTVGRIGAGKSTHVQTLLSRYPGAALIHPDGLRLELTGSESDFTRDSFIWGTLIPIRFHEAKIRDLDIIFDATMVSRKARRPIIKLAKENGYRVVAHVLNTPLDECLRRNASRARVVPEEVVRNMAAKWQDPELSEGIDEITEASC